MSIHHEYEWNDLKKSKVRVIVLARDRLVPRLLGVNRESKQFPRLGLTGTGCVTQAQGQTPSRDPASSQWSVEVRTPVPVPPVTREGRREWLDSRPQSF